MARNKSKRNSIQNFVAVVLLTIIGIVLSVCSFNIPYTTRTYNGFAKSISLGLDLAGGISIVYDCSLSSTSNTKDLDRAIDATVKRLESVIGDNYSEARIDRQGGSRIRIEVPSVTDSDEIFELIGDPTPLYITLAEDEYVEGQDLSGADITDVYASIRQEDNEPGFVITFNKAGARKFNKLTSDAASGSQMLYVHWGEVGDADTRTDRWTVNEAIGGNSTFISGGYETFEQAEDAALQVMSGTFNVDLELIESSVISATLGANALKYCLIGGFVGLVLIMILLWWRYGDFGLLADFALVIYIVLMLFFLQAISFVQLTLPGLAGIILSIGMAVDGTVIIFERVREEYRAGKRIPLASKSGFKRAFWPIFDSNITTIMTAIVLYILGTASIQGFAITLLIGILLSMFMNLVILRFFVKWYLPFNSVKGKKLHLPKQVRQPKDPQIVEVLDTSTGRADK